MKLGSLWSSEDCFTCKIIISIQKQIPWQTFWITKFYATSYENEKSLSLVKLTSKQSLTRIRSEIEKSTDNPHWTYSSSKILEKANFYLVYYFHLYLQPQIKLLHGLSQLSKKIFPHVLSCSILWLLFSRFNNIVYFRIQKHTWLLVSIQACEDFRSHYSCPYYNKELNKLKSNDFLDHRELRWQGKLLYCYPQTQRDRKIPCHSQEVLAWNRSHRNHRLVGTLKMVILINCCRLSRLVWKWETPWGHCLGEGGDPNFCGFYCLGTPPPQQILTVKTQERSLSGKSRGKIIIMKHIHSLLHN